MTAAAFDPAVRREQLAALDAATAKIPPLLAHMDDVWKLVQSYRNGDTDGRREQANKSRRDARRRRGGGRLADGDGAAVLLIGSRPAAASISPSPPAAAAGRVNSCAPAGRGVAVGAHTSVPDVPAAEGWRDSGDMARSAEPPQDRVAPARRSGVRLRPAGEHLTSARRGDSAVDQPAQAPPGSASFLPVETVLTATSSAVSTAGRWTA